MCTWRSSDADRLRIAYTKYLKGAVRTAGPSFYRNEKEGWWQNRICIDFGRQWTPDLPWLVIDREVVLGHVDARTKGTFFDDITQRYRRLRAALQSEDPRTWGTPTPKGLGDELDLLALGPNGELVCLELKHRSNTSGIYFGPLQVATYRDAFRAARVQVWEGVERLVRQKVRLGLLPALAEQRLGNSDLVTAILLVGDPNERSSCWEKARAVKARCPEADVPIMGLDRTEGFHIRSAEPDPSPSASRTVRCFDHPEKAWLRRVAETADVIDAGTSELHVVSHGRG